MKNNNTTENRKWCIITAIELFKKDESLAIQDIIDIAASIERYIASGQHSRTVELGAVEAAFDDAETATANVSRDKVRKVREFVFDIIGSGTP